MDSTLCAPQFAPFKVDFAVAKAERHSWSRGTRQGQYHRRQQGLAFSAAPGAAFGRRKAWPPEAHRKPAEEKSQLSQSLGRRERPSYRRPRPGTRLPPSPSLITIEKNGNAIDR